MNNTLYPRISITLAGQASSDFLNAHHHLVGQHHLTTTSGYVVQEIWTLSTVSYSICLFVLSCCIVFSCLIYLIQLNELCSQCQSLYSLDIQSKNSLYIEYVYIWYIIIHYNIVIYSLYHVHIIGLHLYSISLDRSLWIGLAAEESWMAKADQKQNLQRDTTKGATNGPRNDGWF